MAVPAAISPDHELRRARLAVLGVGLLYASAHLAWYGSTPLGGFPVLDGREMLEMARQIAAGEVPAEPFYRAPLYPALIALWILAGVPDGLLPDAARLLNLIAHLASVMLVFELARRAWDGWRAGLCAGLLYALYPVALFYAGDPFDITLATALALAATLAAWTAGERRSASAALLAAALYALAALARPNFLACLAAFGLWLLWLARAERGNWRLLPAALAGAVLVLVAMGLVNLRVGGEFRVLPWQGSHALWDANGPGANGLFYSHTIPIPDLVPGTNPARVEAETLYCRERDCASGIDIDAFSGYWRERMRDYALAHPGEVAERFATKAWYFVNDYDQYNNKTYWVHKDWSPWLRWNPLGWGLLLALAAGALCLPLPPRMRALLLLVGAAYAASVLLYFVSGRFRLPLASLLCVLAGGWVLLPGWWRTQPRRARLGLVAALLVGAIAHIPVPDHLREGTVIEDWALSASAALAAGDWRAAEDWAQKVIARTPDRTAAVALVCSARLHAWEASPSPELPPREWLEESLSWCAASSQSSHRAAYNATFFLAGLCRHPEAIGVWKALRESRLVGELARNALESAGIRSLKADDKVAGILEVMRAPAAERKPGLKSMLTAIDRGHCSPPTPAAPAGPP